MSSKKKSLWLLCLFLCAITIVNAQIDLSDASRLMQEQNYTEANLAYEYVAFRSLDPAVKIQAKLGRAQALKKLHAYERGMEVLGSVNLMSTPDTLRPAIIYEMVLLSFLDNDFQESIARGQMGASLLSGSQYENAVFYLLVMAALEEEDWDKAKTFGQKYLHHVDEINHSDTLQIQFESLMNRNLPVLKDPEKARKWSTIIPGSGQIYAGSWGDGIYNFGLHAVVLGISGWAFLSGYYVTGWLSGATILQKLHSGGQTRAAEICVNKNRLSIQEYTQPIKKFLINVEKVNR